MGYRNGDEELVGAMVCGGAMAGGVGCSLLRCSSASFNKTEAWGGEEAHRESNGDGRSDWKASKGAVDGGGDLRKEGGCG